MIEGEDGGFCFLRPDGREIPAAPPLPELEREIMAADDALAMLGDLMSECGVDLDPRAIYPQWDGSRLDLSWALAALMN